MNKYHDLHFNRDVITIYPGEFCTPIGSELISTILGSCISIALFDTKKCTGGMNHFMLAKNYEKNKKQKDNDLGRFGEYAVDLLLEDMLKKGSEFKNLTAKIFGGSNVLDVPSKNSGMQIGDSNIQFAFNYLKEIKIPIVSSDTGGIYPRKIFFDPKTSKVWLKRINTTLDDSSFIVSQEQKYLFQLNQKSLQDQATK